MTATLGWSGCGSKESGATDPVETKATNGSQSVPGSPGQAASRADSVQGLALRITKTVCDNELTPAGLTESLAELRPTSDGYWSKFGADEMRQLGAPRTAGTLVTLTLRNDGPRPISPPFTYCDLAEVAVKPATGVACGARTPDGWCVYNGPGTMLCDYRGVVRQTVDCKHCPGSSARLTTLV